MKLYNQLKLDLTKTIHEYILKWYNTNDPLTYPLMKEISALYVEQYPDDVFAYK